MEELYNQLINYFNKKDSQQFHLIEDNTKEYYMFTVCLKPLSRYKLTFKYFLKDNILIYAFYNNKKKANLYYNFFLLRNTNDHQFHVLYIAFQLILS